MLEINVLLYELEYPFNMLPFESVCAHLGSLIKETNQSMYGRKDWRSSTAPKYRTPEDDHDIEVVNLFIGSAFVLSQAAITQTVSIAKRLYFLAGEPDWLPKGKNDIMSTEAIIHAKTGTSKFILYDAIANYFKHHYEWSSNWNDVTATQRLTVETVQKLGFDPKNEDNFHIALQSLNMKINDMSIMGQEIQEWRERLAIKYKVQLQNHGVI